MQYLWTIKGGSQVLPWLPAKSITFEWGSWSKNERMLFKWAEFWRKKGEPNCSRRWQTTFLFIRSASLIRSLAEVQQHWLSYKICLAVQLEAKQSWLSEKIPTLSKSLLSSDLNLEKSWWTSFSCIPLISGKSPGEIWNKKKQVQSRWSWWLRAVSEAVHTNSIGQACLGQLSGDQNNSFSTCS